MRFLCCFGRNLTSMCFLILHHFLVNKRNGRKNKLITQKEKSRLEKKNSFSNHIFERCICLCERQNYKGEGKGKKEREREILSALISQIATMATVRACQSRSQQFISSTCSVIFCIVRHISRKLQWLLKS